MVWFPKIRIFGIGHAGAPLEIRVLRTGLSLFEKMRDHEENNLDLFIRRASDGRSRTKSTKEDDIGRAGAGDVGTGDTP